jgi:RNA polymerase sigma-70 factor (ECF subfamily)
LETTRHRSPKASAPGIFPEPDRVLDEALVESALGGDRGAFEAIVRRHQRALVNHLYRLTGQRDEAFDLAQDVFIKVYQSLASFDPKYRFTTWLYRIASNCAIDHLRKRHPRTFSLSQVAGSAEGSTDAPAVAGSGPNPDEVVQLRELEARLEVAIRALPTGYRQLILLRHRHHCRYDEIARITRLPMGTVKNRIFRAREILKVHLADFLEHEA